MIVFAGSDSSGGAGIAADVAAVCSLGARPLPVVTAVTAQTSEDGLLSLQPMPAALIEAQFAAACRECGRDSTGAAAKVGMLADADSIRVVAGLLAGFSGLRIVDPVCGPSAGGSWADRHWHRAFMREMPAACDLLTPNLAEARFLAGLSEAADPAAAGSVLVAAGFARVLITDAAPEDAQLATDALFSSNPAESFSLSGPRVKSPAGGGRGTGCTLSSAIAASVAAHPGASCIRLGEEITVGKMQAASHCRGQAGAPAPDDLPQVQASWLDRAAAGFPRLEEPLGVCPITDDPARIGEFAGQGFTSAQLRIKDRPEAQIAEACAAAAAAAGRLRLFVNDHWQVAAATAGVHGVHLGQEDLFAADLELIAAKRLRLGVSAHGFFELALARSLQPSYVSLGPVFEPNSKDLPALGLARLRQLLAAPAIPAPVAIGGIGAGQLSELRRMGIGGVACIQASAQPAAAAALLAAWRAGS